MQPPQSPNSGPGAQGHTPDPVPGFGPRDASAPRGSGQGAGSASQGRGLGADAPGGSYPTMSTGPGGPGNGGTGGTGHGGNGGRGGSLFGGLPSKKVGIIIAAVLAVILIVAALIFFVFSDRSPEARAQKDIESTLQNLSEVTSVEEFSEQICEEYRPDADVMNSLSEISSQSGVDFDAQFTEQIRGAFPASLDVESVDLDGENATAHVTSSDDEGASTDEDVKMREEDGSWLVCDPAVGTGGLPAGQGQ